MSNYTKTTNFATKDNLSPGNPLKIVKGTEIDTEYNNIATAVATKTDNSAAAITGGSITGITDLAVADGGTGASTAAGALNNLLPSQTSNANKYLQTDGTNATWDAVSLSTADITGTLGVANGGTGVTTSTGTTNVVLSNSPTLVTPILGTPTSATLTNATGLPISTGVSGLGTGVATFLGTPSSANLISALTDETGTGSAVFATSPTLVTPILGTPTSATLTNATGLPIASGVSGLGTGVATFLATPSSANLLSALTDETGTGSAVFATSPTLVTPLLGTPTSGVATNLTGLPLTTGVTGLLPVANGGTGTATPSIVAGTNVTVTGTWPNQTIAASGGGGSPGGSTTQVQYNNAGAFAGITGATTNGTALTLVAPVLGTPASATLTNATGLPISTGVSGLGTGIATALAVNTGSAGAPVLFNGALGTPTSGTVTNLTGTASININGTVGATTPATGAFTSVTSTGGTDFQNIRLTNVTTNTTSKYAGVVSTHYTTANRPVAMLLGFNDATANNVYLGGGQAGVNAATNILFYTASSSNTNIGTQRVEINNAGTLIPSGLVDISGASAGQIKFPATQNASSDANTLDDYEEGTWTPTLSSIGNWTGTPTTTYAKYIKIGQSVFIEFQFNGTVTTGSTTTYFLTTLPITATSTSVSCGSNQAEGTIGTILANATTNCYVWFPASSGLTSGAHNPTGTATYSSAN